jgi:membrane protein implicated in regulation of membrane protease activity
MGFRLLADLTVLVHFAFVLFVVGGALLVARWRKLLPLHVACAGWGAYIEFAGRVCPLTPLENRLRRLAGQAGYEGGFVEHYIIPVLYPAGLTADLQMTLGWLVVAVNVVLYSWVWWRWRRRKQTA